MENCLDKSGVAYLWSKIKSLVSGKQDTINDLSTIRSNASLGASAIQSSEKGTTNGICPLDSSGKVIITYSATKTDDKCADACRHLLKEFYEKVNKHFTEK